jgi:acetyltransferase
MDWVHRMHLADGRGVLIRRAVRSDGPQIQRFMQSLSAQSRYERFFHPLRELTHEMLNDIVQSDEAHGGALLAFADAAHTDVVGMAQFEVVEPGHAEVAVVVSESWRRVGLATQLLTDLEVLAASAGIGEAHADIRRGNAAALTLARGVGCVVDTSVRAPYTIHVTKPAVVVPSARSLASAVAKH